MAVTDQILYTNRITYANKGNDFLSPLLADIFDQDDISLEQQTDVISLLGYVKTQAITPDQTFSIMVGAEELDFIEEGQDIPTMKRIRGKGKGFTIKQFGSRLEITKLFYKWIESAKPIEDADSSVREEWMRLAEDILSLQRGRRKTLNIEAMKLLTEGWTSTEAAGPGSATPYGQPLFSSAHPYGNGANAGTFSNVLTTPDEALSESSLQDALDKIKQTRLQNADRVMTPRVYKLVVSRVNAVTARSILNTPGNQVNMYSGTGSNANQMNTFSFSGNMVEIVELDQLGLITKDGSTIGDDNYWFLMNAEGCNTARAARHINLYEAEVKMYENDSNNNRYVQLDLGFAIDHYGLEAFVVGSRGSA